MDDKKKMMENMDMSRYETGTKSHRTYLILSLITIGVYIVYLFIAFTSTNELVPILPGDAVSDVVVLLIIMPILGYSFIIFTPLIAMLYYKLYRKIQGDAKTYFLDMRVQLGGWTSKDILKRSLTPGLLICSLTQIIVTTIGINSWVPPAFADNMILALYNAAFFTLIIVILLLSPLWLLYDAGVMSKTTSEMMFKKRTPETVETLDKFYMSKFKGFAGLAFIVNFIAMIIQTALAAISPFMMLFVFILPFLGIALILPLQAIYEKMLPLLTGYIHKKTMLHKAELSLVSAENCPACNRMVKKNKSLY